MHSSNLLYLCCAAFVCMRTHLYASWCICARGACGYVCARMNRSCDQSKSSRRSITIMQATVGGQIPRSRGGVHGHAWSSGCVLGGEAGNMVGGRPIAAQAGCELPNEHPPAARQRGRTHRCPLLGSVIDTRVPMRVGMTSLRTFSRPFFAKPQNDDFSCAQLSLCAQL